MITMLLAAASAAPPALQWNPTASHVRYGFVNDLRISRELVALSAAVAPPQVDLHTEMDLECDLASKASRTEFTCAIRDVVVQSATDAVAVQEWTHLTADTLSAASVHFDVSPKGRVKKIDLQTPNALVWPHRSMVMLVVERSLAGLDLELPRSGTEIWAQEGGRVAPQPGEHRALFRTQQQHRVTGRTESGVTVTSIGDLSWLPDSTVLEQESRIAGRLESTALFDTRRNLLAQRTWRAELGKSQWYVQLATVQLLSATEPMPFSGLRPTLPNR